MTIHDTPQQLRTIYATLAEHGVYGEQADTVLREVTPGARYDTWRDAFQGRRTTQTIRDARSLAMLCLRHGLTGSAAFYRWMAGTLEKLSNRTPQADLHTATRNFQRAQERVNRAYL